MSGFGVRLFRQFGLYWNRELLDRCEASKAQELLSYLLVHRDRPHSREQLATLLWEKSSDSRSKQYLRQMLWQLQSALDHPGYGGPSLLLVDADWIQVNLSAGLWIDVAEFERAYEGVRGVAGRTLDAATAATLEKAVDLYRGDFLENWYQDWCIFERERLQNIYLAMLDKLVGYCEAARAYEPGMAFGLKILRCEKAHERTYRRLMRLHYFAGDRTGALRHFARCARVLQEELGVEPARRTIRLFRKIQADELTPRTADARTADVHTVDAHTAAARTADAAIPPAVGSGDEPEAPQEASYSLPDSRTRLARLRKTLAEAQRQVEREIAAVEAQLAE